MESSCKKNKKTRKKVTIHCRKLNSTSNRSQRSFLHSTSASKYKNQINTLLKNNKVLALALEDTRCELSTKQKLLDDLYHYLNNMMFARFRMLEMQSALKTFINNFDEVLLFLKVDSSKCPDLGIPSRSCKSWKNKMKKIVESVEIRSESVDDEIIDIVHEAMGNSPNHILNTSKKFAEERQDEMEKNCPDTNVNVLGMHAIPINMSDKINMNEIDDENNIIKTHNQCFSNSSESLSTSQASNAVQETGSQLTSVLPSEDCEGMMPLKTAEKVLPLNSEDCGTPKLNISMKRVAAETVSELKANSLNKSPPSSNGNNSEMLKNSTGVMPPVKVHHSKIPKMQTSLFKNKVKANASDTISKSKLTKTKFAIGVKEPNLNSSQSKKLIIKDSKRKSEHEPAVILDEISTTEILSDENTGESCKTDNCRKTFVIKSSDASENTQNSPYDRRKTFVKERNDVSKESESIRNRRETYVLPEHSSTLSKLNKECVKHDKNAKLVKCIQNDVYLCTNENEKDEPNSITVKSSEEHQNNGKNFDDVNKDYSHDLQQDNGDCLMQLKNTFEDKNSKQFNKKTTCEANDKSHAIKDSVNCDLANNLENILKDDSIELCYNKPVTDSSKLLLESPQSECESIPKLDLSSVNEAVLIQKTPIRRRISNTNKTLFFFDINKESIPNGDCVYKSCDFDQHNTVSCQLNVDSLSNKVKKYKVVENQKEKIKEKENFICSNEKNNIIDSISSDLVDRKKGLMKKRASKGKVKSKTRNKRKCADTEIKDCITSTTVSSCFENKDPNEIQEDTRKHHDSSVAMLNKNKALNEGERVNCSSKNEDNMNIKSHIDDIKLNASFGKVKNKDKCYKTNAKRNVSMDDDIDDIISVSKKGKRTNLKKKTVENAYLDVNKMQKENAKQSVTMDDASDDIIIISVSKRRKRKNAEKKTTESVCLDAETQNFPKRAKHKGKTSTVLCNIPEKNTFLVHADVHPVPSSYMPETGINKENEEIQEELQVSVVLNDIFKSENSRLSACGKDQAERPESRNFPLKTVLTDNSCNIPLPVDGTMNSYKNTVVATNNSEEVVHPKRRQRTNVNYKEKPLNRKLRR